MAAYGAVAHARARLATLTRWEAPSDELDTARQDLDVAKVLQALARLVKDWTLTDEQRGRLTGAVWS